MIGTSRICDVREHLNAIAVPLMFQLATLTPAIIGKVLGIVQVARIGFDVVEQDSAHFQCLQRISSHQTTHRRNPISQIWPGLGGQPQQTSRQGLDLFQDLGVDGFHRLEIRLAELEVRKSHTMLNLPAVQHLFFVPHL